MSDSIRDRLVYGTYKLPQEYKEFRNILIYCVDQGIKWIDTAPIYNKGLSESWIGRWLEESNRGEIKISTKAGKLYDDFGRLIVINNMRNLLKSVEGSLYRLQQNRIELLFLHDYEVGRTHKEISDSIEGLLGTGLIKKVGLSNFPLEVVEQVGIENKIECIQIDASSMNIREHISHYNEIRIPIWIYRPFNQGRTIKKYKRKPWEIIREFADEFPNCKFVFGSSKLNQLEWLEKL